MKLPQWVYSSLGIGLIVICVIAANVIGSLLSWRLDLTQEGLYTISHGTKQLIQSLETPVTLKFFFLVTTPSCPLPLSLMPSVFKSCSQNTLSAPKVKLS